MLCSGNLQSASCERFVAAADALAALYRSEVEKHPGWKAKLGRAARLSAPPGTGRQQQ